LHDGKLAMFFVSQRAFVHVRFAELSFSMPGMQMSVNGSPTIPNIRLQEILKLQ